MKKIIFVMFTFCMLIQTTQACWLCCCLSRSKPAQPETPDIESPKALKQFDAFIEANNALHKKQLAQAFHLLTSLKEVDDQISFLKNFFQLNKQPQGCVLSPGHLQQITNLMHQVKASLDYPLIKMPREWRVYLLLHTQQPPPG
jgi:hypothetical protein